MGGVSAALPPEPPRGEENPLTAPGQGQERRTPIGHRPGAHRRQARGHTAQVAQRRNEYFSKVLSTIYLSYYKCTIRTARH